MVEQDYRAVIIGLGGIAAARPEEPRNLPLFEPMPYSHASAYRLNPRTEVVAVCDLSQEMLDGFVDTWKDVWPDVRTYTDYQEMLDREEPDLVSVVTSDHLHAEITVAAVEGSAKGIYCEKPIATTLEDADRMIEAAEGKGVPLSIDHTRRWNPSFLKARELVRSGEIGPVRTIVSELFTQRAMLFRNGTHLIDMICFFANDSPTWVSAELEDGFEWFTSYQGGGGRDPSRDPSASIYIRFDNGVRAFYNSAKINLPMSQFLITCEDGQIQISDHWARLTQGESYFKWHTSEILPGSYALQQQAAGIAELIDVIENGGELVSPGREARKTVEIMLAALKSNEEGNRRVNLPLGK